MSQPQTLHPPQHRSRVSGRLLLFILLAAPSGWILQELLGWAIASQQCGMRSAQEAAAMVRAGSPWFWLLIAIAFLLALSGTLAAWTAWRATRAEKSGSGHHLAELGEGRTRFLAMCGLITSAGFLLALLFHLVQLVAAPLCGK